MKEYDSIRELLVDQTTESFVEEFDEFVEHDIIRLYSEAMTTIELTDISELKHSDILFCDSVSGTVNVADNGYITILTDGRNETLNEFFYMWNLSDFSIRRLRSSDDK